MIRNSLFFLLLLLGLTACEIDEQVDPNGPSINSVLNNATRTQLNLLVSGTEAAMRVGYANYVTATGIIARELYLFNADPRNTEDLLGKENLTIDANTFYLTGPYNSRYRVVKNTNILLESLDNTTQVSETEKDGYRGFANTIKAYMLFQVLNMLDQNGIRVDVADPNNLGPFLSKEASFDAIQELLDEAYDQLQGSEFSFDLSAGFDGFDSPETFAEFNRALAAKVALYDEEYQEALNILPQSFFELRGDIYEGPEHVFSTSSGDILNPLFKNPGQSGDQIIVHPSIIADTFANDDRNRKFGLRLNPTSQDDLNGLYETRLYATNVSPISIIRNEELILIYAEASIQVGNLQDAVEGIDAIREAHGLPPYSGPVTREALIEEMLRQRKYSFWSEGHRMFDLRRYGLLNANYLPIDRPGDDVFTQFPIPLSEGV